MIHIFPNYAYMIIIVRGDKMFIIVVLAKRYVYDSHTYRRTIERIHTNIRALCLYDYNSLRGQNVDYCCIGQTIHL